MKGALKQVGKTAIENLSDFAKSFKDKFNIDAYHGTSQEVAINPIFTIFDVKKTLAINFLLLSFVYKVRKKP